MGRATPRSVVAAARLKSLKILCSLLARSLLQDNARQTVELWRRVGGLGSGGNGLNVRLLAAHCARTLRLTLIN